MVTNYTNLYLKTLDNICDNWTATANNGISPKNGTSSQEAILAICYKYITWMCQKSQSVKLHLETTTVTWKHAVFLKNKWRHKPV